MKFKQILPAVILYALGGILVMVGAIIRMQGDVSLGQPLLIAGLTCEALGFVYTVYAVIKHGKENPS